MFYLPTERKKFFHAAHGKIDCIHPTRPKDLDLTEGRLQFGRYVAHEWQKTLRTSIYRRLAEIWVVSSRLWSDGIGPQPLGVCFVEKFTRDKNELGATCGILTQNVFSLPRKLNCKLEHIQNAGVIPDKILSCVRQQIRGYVVDLCSVVGCRPADAEKEVAQLESLFQGKPPAIELVEILTENIRKRSNVLKINANGY